MAARHNNAREPGGCENERIGAANKFHCEEAQDGMNIYALRPHVKEAIWLWLRLSTYAQERTGERLVVSHGNPMCDTDLASHPGRQDVRYGCPLQFRFELAGVCESLLGSRRDVVRMRIRDTRRFAESRLGELRKLFSPDPVTTRTEGAKHGQKITLTPEWESYIPAAIWNVPGLGSRDGAGGQNRTGYARLFRAALYQ